MAAMDHAFGCYSHGLARCQVSDDNARFNLPCIQRKVNASLASTLDTTLVFRMILEDIPHTCIVSLHTHTATHSLVKQMLLARPCSMTQDRGHLHPCT